MKKNGVIGVAVLAVLVFAVSIAVAGTGKGWRGSGGWGMAGGYQRMYNTATVETVTGEIESIDWTVPMKGMSRGVHVTLKAEKGPVSVHLGPEWYIERLDGKLMIGDHVEVKGSRVMFEGNPAIIAAEVRKGNEVLMLRDENGIPAWAGWRR